MAFAATIAGLLGLLINPTPILIDEIIISYFRKMSSIILACFCLSLGTVWK